MAQLNFLPVNISQNVELKDESTSFNSAASKGDFSQYIDQHLTKSKESEGIVSVDELKSEANSAKDSDSQIEYQRDTKTLDDSSDNNDITSETKVAADSSVIVQKIAADGNKPQIVSSEREQKGLSESEQLMSFLTKADKTLLNQSIDMSSVTSSSEQMPIDQKTNNEAELLLNASHLVADLSAVAKALEKEHADVMLTPTLSPKMTEQRLPEEELGFSNELNVVDETSTSEKLSVGVAPILTEKAVPVPEIAVNSGIKDAVSESTKGKLFVEAIQGKVNDHAQTETPITVVKANENKAVLTDLETNSVSEAKVANANGDKIKAQPIPSQVLPSQALPSKSSVDGDLETANLEDAAPSEEQKITNQLNKQSKIDQVQMSNAQINENSLQKTAIKTSAQEAQSLSQLAANANANANANEKVNHTAVTQANVSQDNNVQAQADAVKSLGKNNDLMTTKINQSEQVLQEKKLSSFDSQLVKNESVQNSEVTALNKKSNQAAVNMNTTALSSNQFSDSDLSSEEANKALAKQDDKVQLSAFLSDQNQQKSAANNAALIDGKVMEGNKNGVSFNTNTNTNNSFIDVTGKATESAQDIIEHQSIERLNPSVATEVTQSQKTNTQLHQETISLFRKDFADAVKDKVMLIISQKLQRFDITLDPPELGNMQVRVNLQGEQAAVNFIVQSQQTKDALEQNMHKLRDLLAEQGVDVGDANVEQQSQQSSNGEETTAGYNNQMEDNMAEANDVVAHTLSAQMIDSSTASVDYYA